MIDWNLVAKIAGGGYGVTILVLVIISLIAWGMAWIIQRTKTESEETPPKDG
jgi:hypothetical protein